MAVRKNQGFAGMDDVGLGFLDDEAAVVTCMRHETLHVDTIITRSGRTPAAVLQILLALELKGIVQQLAGKHFAASVVDVRRIPAKE
jgi:predicted Rossmann fold nucleotide-binding protein DprA/Smf involved in DNA uptake